MLRQVSLCVAWLMSDYRKTTSGDIVSMLLNIYDTKEVFVKELQVILAERLLASKDYNAEKEVISIDKCVDRQHRNLEMIKVRFGEANVQQCDVMLKDITESKRVDRVIHSRAQTVVLLLRRLTTGRTSQSAVSIFLASIARREAYHAR